MNRIFKVTLLSAFFCFAPIAATAQTPNTSWYTTADTATKVCTLYTDNDLAGLAQIVNGTWTPPPGFKASFNFNKWTIILEDNIDLSVNYGASYNSGAGWIPIGLTSTFNFNFAGKFDGNGKIITGLYINKTGNNSGLFGYVTDSSSVVKNLVVKNANVTGTNYVGVIAGFVGGGSLIECYTKGGSVSGNDYVGGVTGYISTGNLTYCKSTASVTGDNNVGGIVGYVNGNNTVSSSIISCYSTDSVSGNNYVGGVAGYLYNSYMANSYSTASVTGTGSVGGVAGRQMNGGITSCYFIGSVEGTSNYVGGLVGYLSNAILTNSYSAGSYVTGNNNVGGLVGTLTAGGTISYCAALNQNVTAAATPRAIGRIVSTNGGTLNDNLAWDSMAINVSPLTIGPNTINGGNITSQDLFDGSIGGLFVNDTNPWVTANCKLPGFRKPVNMPQYLVNLAVLTNWIESTTYEASQVYVTDAASANDAVQAIINSLVGANLSLLGVTVTVNDRLFSPADSLTGTNGGYAFTVTLSDSGGTSLATTTILILTIEAIQPALKKRAEPPAAAQIAAISDKFTIGPNPAAKHSGPVNFFWQGRTINNGTLSIYSASGTFIKKISISDKGSIGDLSKRQIGKWNLTDSKGRAVSAGTYAVKGTVIGKDGKKESISSVVGVR